MHFLAILLVLLGAASCYSCEPISPKEKQLCFCAREWNVRPPILYDFEEFKSMRQDAPTLRYEDFYQDERCADMIFGTAFTSKRYYDILLPSYDLTKKLMEDVQNDTIRYLQAKNPRLLCKVDWRKVLGVYPMRGATFAMEGETPYVKIPLTNQSLIGSSLKQDVMESGSFLEKVRQIPETCTVVDDVIDTGRTTFKTVAKLVDDFVPHMDPEAEMRFKIVLALAICKNGRDEDVNVIIDGKSYPLGTICFRGSVRDRLMMHAKLRVMNEYMNTGRYCGNDMWKKHILALNEEERTLELRKCFLHHEDLNALAFKRYMQYVDSNVICKVTVDDFVRKGWIDQESVDNLWIAFPQTSVSAHTGLDMTKTLDAFRSKHSLMYCLEPMIFIPSEGIILHTSADHSNVSEEIIGNANLHESNILTLHPVGFGHFQVDSQWLSQCKGRAKWKKGEKIGVVVLDPFHEPKLGQRFPKQGQFPDLVADIRKGMRASLQAEGYDVVFAFMQHDGTFCSERDLDFPVAERKRPICHKLVDSTVRVLRNSEDFLRTLTPRDGAIRVIR